MPKCLLCNRAPHSLFYDFQCLIKLLIFYLLLEFIFQIIIRVKILIRIHPMYVFIHCDLLREGLKNFFKKIMENSVMDPDPPIPPTYYGKRIK